MIEQEIQGHTLLVKFNRPKVRNAWNAELAQGLHDSWRRLDEDDDLRSCVITGGDFFSAGMDLKAPPMELGTLAMPNLSVPCDKPIICAVEGGAIGYASVLCLLADMVIAGESAYFLYPEGKMGVFQGMMGGFPGRLQYKAGLQWIMTAEPMAAPRAREVGMVNEVVPDGQSLTRALALAERINASAPLVIQAMKAIALGTVTKGPMEQNYRTNRLIARIASSEDGKEGFAAFKEKRTATFRGR